MEPLKISARGRYSMQALFDLAHYSHGQPVPLHLIAQRQDLSLPFLEQIFNRLKKAGIELDRKILSDIAIHDAAGFTKLAEQAKAALAAEKKVA